MTIEEQLKWFRHKKGLTQMEVGIRLGYSRECAQKNVSRYELGLRTIPRKHLKLMAEILEMPVANLLP